MNESDVQEIQELTAHAMVFIEKTKELLNNITKDLLSTDEHSVKQALLYVTALQLYISSREGIYKDMQHIIMEMHNSHEDNAIH